MPLFPMAMQRWHQWQKRYWLLSLSCLMSKGIVAVDLRRVSSAIPAVVDVAAVASLVLFFSCSLCCLGRQYTANPITSLPSTPSTHPPNRRHHDPVILCLISLTSFVRRPLRSFSPYCPRFSFVRGALANAASLQLPLLRQGLHGRTLGAWLEVDSIAHACITAEVNFYINLLEAPLLVSSAAVVLLLTSVVVEAVAWWKY